MQCELCGKYIEQGYRIKVEGSIFVVCDKCSNYGEIVTVERAVRKVVKKDKKKKIKIDFNVDFEEVLKENFHEIIKKKREERGMKQEELAKIINEPVSLIKRIESGKIEPELSIIKKTEKALHVKLTETEKVDKEENSSNIDKKEEITIGDLIVIKKRKN